MSLRAVLAIVALVALAGVSAAVGLDYLGRLPDPATADEAGLMRWLVSEDLAQQPAGTQRQVLARLERFLDENADDQATRAADVLEQIDWQQRTMLAANLDLLLSRWMRGQIDTFCALDPSLRGRWIDGQLDRVGRWNLAEWTALTNTDAAAVSSSSAPTSSAAALLQWANDWVARQAPQQQQRANELLSAAKRRWLMRALFGDGESETRSPF